uniref:MOSC domain-containing protein n=1 Tax=Ditylenchus dipsaci TaxID=166011 RepID=A0A915DPB8_9BILA
MTNFSAEHLPQLGITQIAQQFVWLGNNKAKYRGMNQSWKVQLFLTLSYFCRLHNKACTDGYDCGLEVGAFLTKFLEVTGNRDLRLLYFVDGIYTERDYASKSVYWNNPVPVLQDQIAYADLTSYHALTTASVDDLNTRLAEQNESISALNFRPNIVVSGVAQAYDEDRWLHVRIGEQVEFVCFKPCTRCVLTTVHPTEGKKNDKMEPLRELRNYRLAPPGKLLDEYQKSPIFGVNMALVKGGRIHVGDEVQVRYKPTPF